ncbi:MAG: helix-turn-helix domain-containing protein [Halanaerobiales bacterium]|nr:helix-turn-helix domain-containing protein [Halanaerobiales bacterium]
MTNEMLTVEDMRKFLKIGRNKAYELVAQKKVPFVRIGSEIRIPKHLLMNHVEKAALNQQQLPEYDMNNVVNFG